MVCTLLHLLQHYLHRHGYVTNCDHKRILSRLTVLLFTYICILTLVLLNVVCFYFHSLKSEIADVTSSYIERRKKFVMKKNMLQIDLFDEHLSLTCFIFSVIFFGLLLRGRIEDHILFQKKM